MSMGMIGQKLVGLTVASVSRAHNPGPVTVYFEGGARLEIEDTTEKGADGGIYTATLFTFTGADGSRVLTSVGLS